MRKKPKVNKQYLNIIQYTEESYFRCFPHASEDDYIDHMLVDEEETVRIVEREHKIKIAGIRRILIDDEYFHWLNKNKESDNSSNHIQYGNQLSDEDVIRIRYKHEDNFVSEIFFIPVQFVSNEMNFTSQNIRINHILENTIRNILSNICDSSGVREQDIIIFPELIRPDYYSDYFGEQFENSCYNYFSGNNESFELNPRPLLVAQQKVNSGIRYLPVGIKTLDKAVLSMKELNNELLPTYLPEQLMKRWEKDLEVSLGGDLKVFVVPSLIHSSESTEFYEDWLESLRKNAHSSGVNFS